MLGRKRSRTRQDAGIAHSLYGAIVTQARSPAFYRDFGVADAIDGRFDLIVLHAFLLLEKLRACGAPGAALSQEVVDLFFLDMDRSLREMGVGDMGVPRRIKTMAQSFFGRSTAYRQAAAGGARAALADAIGRNLFPDLEHAPPAAAALADYVLASLAQDDGALLGGRVTFPDPLAFRPVAVAE